MGRRQSGAIDQQLRRQSLVQQKKEFMRRMMEDVERMRADKPQAGGGGREVAPMVKAPTWPLGATLPRRHSMIPPIKNTSPKRLRPTGRSASVVAERERESIARALARPAKPKLTPDVAKGVGFKKEEFITLSKAERVKLKAARRAGLDTVKAILGDVSFYEEGTVNPNPNCTVAHC